MSGRSAWIAFRLYGVITLASWGSTTLASTDFTDLSLETLLEIPVVGAAKYEQRQDAVAAAVSVISRQEIDAHGWRTLDEALSSLPGVLITYDRQYSYIGTRGFGLPGDFSTRVLVTINGNRTNDVVYDGAATGRLLPIDIDLIERIEYIPGPGGAVYGQNAMFGVVNIVTRNGVAIDGTEIGGSYQDLNSATSGRMTWGRLLDNGVDLVISASAYDTEGEHHFFDFGDAGVAGVARDMDGEEDRDVFARVASGAWSADVSFGDRRKDDPTAQYYSDPLRRGQYQEDELILGQIQYQGRPVSDATEVTGRVFMGQQRYRSVYYYDDSPFVSTGSGDWYGTEARLLWSGWKQHTMMIGVEAQDSPRRDQTGIDLNDPASAVVIRSEGWRASIFGQDEWSLSDTLRATLGMRFDRNDVTGEALSPRLALIWKPTAETAVKALYGGAHRAPNAYESDYADDVSQVANPALDEETVDTTEVVVDHRLGEYLFLRASLYHWLIRDLIVLGTDDDSGLAQYQSGGDVDARGVELSLDRIWDWGGRLRVSLSFQDVEYDDGNRPENSPRLLGKLNFTTRLPWAGLRLGYELQYADERRTLDGSNVGSVWLSNLNLSANEWAPTLEVAVTAFNLFDREYSDPASDINWQNEIEQDGRGVALSLGYRL